ncbi:MAG: hypothetical protein QW606_06345 [Conexivisphaerales archaeon]
MVVKTNSYGCRNSEGDNSSLGKRREWLYVQSLKRKVQDLEALEQK